MLPCFMPTHLGVAQVISVAVVGSCTTRFSLGSLCIPGFVHRRSLGKFKRRLLLEQHAIKAAGYRQLGSCHGSAAWTRSSAAVGSSRQLARCQQRREEGRAREQAWTKLDSSTHGEADGIQQPRFGFVPPIHPATSPERISLLTPVGVVRICSQGAAAWARDE